MISFHTERLVLRAVDIGDQDDFFEYAKHPEVGPNAGWKPHETMAETLEIMKDMFLDKENIWGIVLKENNKLIGTIGMIKDPKRDYSHVKMIGYAIGRPYWGRGLTTEAANALLEYGFGTLKLDMLSAYCYPFNIGSRRVLEKCGFTYEGRLRKVETLYNGKTYDNLCFSITRDEYLSCR